ncbi:MAG: hypothetical protein GWN95_02065 [Gammaproteobacteria bacterium]|nr:hypothetical protein [Gammaproteobacteria bacterium]
MRLAKALETAPSYALSGSGQFTGSESLEHVFTTGDRATLIVRVALCPMVLNRELRESFSSSLMATVKQKLSPEEFQQFGELMQALGPVISSMIPGVEELVDGMEARGDLERLKQGMTRTSQGWIVVFSLLAPRP